MEVDVTMIVLPAHELIILEEEVRDRHYRARLMLSQGAARQLVERASGGAEA